MLETYKNATINGVSRINGKVACSMYGSVGDNNSVSTSIQDFELYSGHFEEVMADMQEFNNKYKELKKDFTSDGQPQNSTPQGVAPGKTEPDHQEEELAE